MLLVISSVEAPFAFFDEAAKVLAQDAVCSLPPAPRFYLLLRLHLE